MIEVISVQYNETFLKPFFDNHYKWVDKITIIDKPFPDGIDDHLRRQWNQEAYEASTADWIIFADADEFVFTYKKYLENVSEEYTHVRCALYHIYPHITETIELNPNLPIKEQRRHGYLEPLYAKPCIVRGKKSISMGLGNHTIYGDQKEAPNYVLGAHWKNCCLEYALETRIKGRRDRFSETNKKYGYGIQDMGITEQDIINEFKQYEDLPKIW